MNPFAELSEKGRKKLILYAAAYRLFEAGKSYPQVIEALKGYEPDEDFLKTVVANAMHENLDTLYQEARHMFGEGKTYDEVVKELSKKENDSEIVRWACNSWYEWKQYYAECMTEGPTNIAEGSQWAIVSVIAIILLFIMHASLISKMLWSLVCLGSIIQWLFGLRQRRLSDQISKIFQSNEQDR
jgi:hypothetical protein